MVHSLNVPLSELQEINIKDEKLKVSGPFVFLRRGKIKFSMGLVGEGAQKAFNSAGEGFVQVYEGTGTIWLHPTSTILGRASLVRGKPTNSIKGAPVVPVHRIPAFTAVQSRAAVSGNTALVFFTC